MTKFKEFFIILSAFVIILFVSATYVTEGQEPEPWHPIDNPPPPELLNAPPPEKPAYISHSNYKFKIKEDEEGVLSQVV